jgi:hypothetical protein
MRHTAGLILSGLARAVALGAGVTRAQAPGLQPLRPEVRADNAVAAAGRTFAADARW